MPNKKILIVGGGAAGASCATRIRRLDEKAEITIFERGEHVSFANCGLPYYVGNVITKRERLFIVTPNVFKKWFNIEVRINHSVESIDRDKKEITVEEQGGRRYTEHYDALVLAQGAAPVVPRLPGATLPGIFTVRTVPDTDMIKSWIRDRNAKSALVAGAGFIGLEMAENLRKLEMRVTLAEMLGQVASFLDPEMAIFIQDHLETHGVELALGNSVAEFRESDNRIKTILGSHNGLKKEIVSDLVILALGVKPETGLAKIAGLATGASGGIEVDGSMRTSDPCVYAIGDSVEVTDAVFPETARFTVPLAGPAQRQGRIAAEHITGFAKKKAGRSFRGSQRTAVCGVFGMTAACTGASERYLKSLAASGDSVDYEKVFLSPLASAGYYPGGSPLFLKLIFEKGSGRILGAQAVGAKGVEKRIDVISMAIQMNGTVFDLEEAELCYAPQYGSAKDPVNMAGMIAANAVRKTVDLAHWESLPVRNSFLLDVRTPHEFESGHVSGAVNVPLHVLRSELDSLPNEKEILLYCQEGQRSYYAARILAQNGFTAKNISGGYVMYEAVSRAISGKA